MVREVHKDELEMRFTPLFILTQQSIRALAEAPGELKDLRVSTSPLTDVMTGDSKSFEQECVSGLLPEVTNLSVYPLPCRCCGVCLLLSGKVENFHSGVYIVYVEAGVESVYGCVTDFWFYPAISLDCSKLIFSLCFVFCKSIV